VFAAGLGGVLSAALDEGAGSAGVFVPVAATRGDAGGVEDEGALGVRAAAADSAGSAAAALSVTGAAGEGAAAAAEGGGRRSLFGASLERSAKNEPTAHAKTAAAMATPLSAGLFS
jgi:hypothetical protein